MSFLSFFWSLLKITCWHGYFWDDWPEGGSWGGESEKAEGILLCICCIYLGIASSGSNSWGSKLKICFLKVKVLFFPHLYQNIHVPDACLHDKN